MKHFVYSTVVTIVGVTAIAQATQAGAISTVVNITVNVSEIVVAKMIADVIRHVRETAVVFIMVVQDKIQKPRTVLGFF